uniref:Predicted protein n=1 Tax=Hordeum vulgare subsp. vulgare TaxID=112509 RepID=F2E3V2_HORVV|nr:predicted protein [Hordeum vulgare subsp. vulgare]
MSKGQLCILLWVVTTKLWVTSKKLCNNINWHSSNNHKIISLYIMLDAVYMMEVTMFRVIFTFRNFLGSSIMITEYFCQLKTYTLLTA